MRMGFLQAFLGNASHALRHNTRAARLHAGPGHDTERFETPFLVGKFAMSAGCYALAQRRLLAGDEYMSGETRPVFLALLYLRVGDMRRVQAQLRLVTPKSLLYFPAQTVYAHVRAELDRLEGHDPVPALRQQLDEAVKLGLSGLNRDLMVCEISSRTEPLAQRTGRAHALLRDIRSSGISSSRQVKTLLEIGEVFAESEPEAGAEVGASASASLIGQAARLLRRGYATHTLCLPDGLLRCARLIRRRDPGEADDLVHVARRWVHKAQAQLPPGAHEGLTREVAVNRLLLDKDPSALYC
jgi:hypothetical protein